MTHLERVRSLFTSEFDATAKALHSNLLRKKYAYLFTVTAWTKYVQLDLSNLTHLQAFLARVAARPAVQAAMKAEGLLR